MKKKTSDHNPGYSGKKDMNARRSSVTQSGEQGPYLNERKKVNNSLNNTGDMASLGKKKENPKDGNIGKNNAGGYE